MPFDIFLRLLLENTLREVGPTAQLSRLPNCQLSLGHLLLYRGSNSLKWQQKNKGGAIVSTENVEDGFAAS